MFFRPQNNPPFSWYKTYRTHENMRFWFISTSKNKNVYLFSVGLLPKGMMMENTMNFSAALTSQVQPPFILLHYSCRISPQHPNTAETAADKPPFGVIHCSKLIPAPVLLSTHRFHVWILIYVYSRIQTLPCLYKL